MKLIEELMDGGGVKELAQVGDQITLVEQPRIAVTIVGEKVALQVEQITLILNKEVYTELRERMCRTVVGPATHPANVIALRPRG